MIARLDRALGGLSQAAALAGGALLLAVAALTMADIAALALGRLGVAVPGIAGYEDAVARLTGAAVPLFFAECQRARGHVAVDLAVAALPRPARRALDRATLALTAAAGAFLAAWMAVGLLQARADGAASPILGLPDWPFYAPGVVGFALWAGVAALQAARG